MAFTEPVLLKRIPDDPAKRKLREYDDYVATGGYASLRKALDMKPDEIIKIVTDSGLRGRGGAGFSRGAEMVVHPQGKEGPALSGGQRRRIRAGHVQGSLPDGLRSALDARRHRHRRASPRRCDIAYIFIRGEYHRQAKVLERAVKEAYDNGIFGQQGIFGSQYKLECYVHRGAGAYICGEETGLLEALEGKRGWPRNKPPFPAIAGAFARPTVINNVETLCLRSADHRERRRRGSRRWARHRSPGPKLYGMSGHVNKPGVYEDELGITLDYAINKLAGGMKGGKYKGAICGGISMGVLGPDQLDIKLDFDDVRFRGGCLGLGTAGMIVMNEHTDMVAALRNCVRFYAHETCGQCTPCREGTRLDDQDPQPHHRRRRPRQRPRHAAWSWKRPWASCPAPPSAAWPTAPPGRRARSSTSITMSSPRDVRKSLERCR